MAVELPPWLNEISAEWALKRILLGLFGSTPSDVTTPASITAVVTPQSVTQATSVIVAASTSQVIPIGAKEWTVTVLTGTATVNGAAACPAGFSDGSTKTLLNTVTVTCASASTAYVRWAT